MSSILTGLFSAADDQLMWRVKTQDDAEAFAKLVKRWESPIQRLCLRMTGDIHIAQDLTQTVFTRLFVHRAAWEPTAKLSTYLWRIALNLCHDENRRTARRGESSFDELKGEGADDTITFVADRPAPDAEADLRERSEVVRCALLRLPADYRQVVVLRHYEGLKFREIADVLEIPIGTVKSRMAEALDRLNRNLKPMENDLCNTRTHTQPATIL